MSTLRVRNLAQKILWEDELAGQISDGRWENSSPREHWVPWGRAEVVVDPDNVGRDFYAQRDGYCFTEKELLSIIGERMLDYVRVATGNPEYSEKEMLKDLRDLRKIIKMTSQRAPVPAQPVGRVEATTHSYVLYGETRSYETHQTVYTPAPADAAPARTFTMADFDLTSA